MALEGEQELAKSIIAGTTYISDSGLNVASGSEGFQAMMEMSSTAGTLSDKEAKAALKTGLAALQRKTTNSGLKTFLGGMLKG